MPVVPSYRNQSIDICTANQLTGFNMRATLAFNGLRSDDGRISNMRSICRCGSYVDLNLKRWSAYFEARYLLKEIRIYS